MSKKILIISPTPTHPTNAGNRIRILNIVDYLIKQGHEVHFLYSDQEKCDEKSMKKYWGDRLYIVKYAKPKPKPENKYAKMIRNRFNSNIKYYSGVDDHYNIYLDDYIGQLLQKQSFDIVFVEYIFNTKAFFHFPAAVIKILDTHDRMTDRHKLFLKEGKKPIWYSTSKNEEKKGLDRADIIIAIQEKEKSFFFRLTNKTVISVGHLVQLVPPVNMGPPREKILFIGSNNPSNLYGINDFIHDVFPLLQKDIPDMELLIAGNICSAIDDFKGVRKLGEVDDIKTAYDMADIVINPLTIGTGLKIKMIEALGYSKAVISTAVGAEGLENGAGKSYLLADRPEEYVNEINKIISDPEVYNSLCNNARSFAGMWNNNNTTQLLELI